jgi:hypothetical protein
MVNMKSSMSGGIIEWVPCFTYVVFPEHVGPPIAMMRTSSRCAPFEVMLVVCLVKNGKEEVVKVAGEEWLVSCLINYSCNSCKSFKTETILAFHDLN